MIAFRFCVPMDNKRPSLDLQYFDNICPDKNGVSKVKRRLCELGLTRGIFQVPVIALFTKYDQFKREIKMALDDEPTHPETDIDAKVKSDFEQHYLGNLSHSESTPYICLECEDFVTDDSIFC